jgi:hypothetical protein
MTVSLRVFGASGRNLQGPGAIAGMGECMARLGSRAALIADRKVLDIAGERVLAACKAAGLVCEPMEFSGQNEPAGGEWPRHPRIDEDQSPTVRCRLGWPPGAGPGTLAWQDEEMK